MATVAELAQEVEALRRQVAALTHQIATEIRTRRLVVVDENGGERIYTDVTPDSAQLAVDVGEPSDCGKHRARTLLLVEADDEGALTADLHIVLAGDSAAIFGGDFTTDARGTVTRRTWPYTG